MVVNNTDNKVDLKYCMGTFTCPNCGEKVHSQYKKEKTLEPDCSNCGANIYLLVHPDLSYEVKTY